MQTPADLILQIWLLPGQPESTDNIILLWKDSTDTKINKYSEMY